MNAVARGYGAKVLIVFSILALPFPALAQNAETAWKQCRAVDTAHAARAQSCTRAIESGALGNDDRAWAYASRANAHRSQFDFPRAEQDFTAALKLNANHLFVRLSRAQFLEQQGKSAQARQEFEWLAARSVSEALDYVWRGRARHSLRRYEEAIADFTQAIALRPRDAEAYARRADAHLMVGGRDKERFKDLTQAIELKYPDASVYISRAYLFAGNDQHDAAIGDYTQAISLSPNQAYAHAGRCRSQVILGRNLDQALKDCDTAIRLHPGEPGFLEDRGLLHLKAGRFADAERDYSAALKAEETPEAYFGRGIARSRQGKAAAATADLAAARQRMPWVDHAFASYGLKP